MNRLFRPALQCAALLLISFAAHAANSADVEKEERQKQQDLSRIRERIQNLNQSQTQDRALQDKLTVDLQGTEGAISRLTAQLRKLDGQISDQTAAVNQTRARKAAVSVRMEKQRDALRQQVRAAYLMGRQQETKLVLNQEDPSRLGRVLTYYDYLNRARAVQITAIREQVAKLEEIETSLQGQLDELLTMQEDRRITLQRLRGTRDQRSVTLKEIRGRISTRNDEITRLRSSETQVQQVLNTVQQALADMPYSGGSDGHPFPKMKGRLPWPVKGRLLARYGQPKAGGPLAWRGLWISAPAGAPVQAVAQGRVVYIGWMHSYGLIVIVEHGSDYYTLYGHSQNTLVNVGQTLQAGQTVATAGDSGGYEETGAYFEIRKGKEAVNPALWLHR